MDIILYKFNKRENSTKIPNDGVPVKGNINSPSSIINPVISFSKNISNIYQYNYAYIDKFSRYYHINNWTYNSGLWDANMIVDVLASYKGEIGSSNQYVTRCSAQYDTDVIDNLYPATANPTTLLNKSYVWFNPFDPSIDKLQPYFVIGIVGNSTNSDTGIVTYYQFNATQFTEFSNKLFGSTEYLGSDFGNITLDALKAQTNPFQYVVSINKYPFKLTLTQATQYIKIGWWNVSQDCDIVLSISPYHTKTLSITIPKHPQKNRGNYLNNSPFSQYMLYVPGFGSKEIPSQFFYDIDTLGVNIITDVTCNKSYLTLYDYNGIDSNIFMQYSGNVGQNIVIGQMSVDYLAAGNSALSAVSSAASGNVAGTISSIGNFINNMQPKLVTSGENSGSGEWGQQAILMGTFATVCKDDNSNNGKPLMQNKTISTIPGYIKCENADIALPGTATENQQVKQYLNGGFFYE